MLTALLVGMLLGFVLAILPGPVGLATIRMSITYRWPLLVRMAVGAGVMDAIYCFVMVVATSIIVSWFQGIDHEYPAIGFTLHLAAALGLVLFGVAQFQYARRGNTHVKKSESTTDANGVGDYKRSQWNWFKTHGMFLVGVGFALASLANPTFLPSIGIMTAFVQGSGVYDSSSTANNMMLSIGFGAGNILWLLLLIRVIIHYRSRMTSDFVRRIYQISGSTLIGFGTLYGARFFLSKMPEMLRFILVL